MMTRQQKEKGARSLTYTIELCRIMDAEGVNEIEEFKIQTLRTFRDVLSEHTAEELATLRNATPSELFDIAKQKGMISEKRLWTDGNPRAKANGKFTDYSDMERQVAELLKTEDPEFS